ncbi:uroporphyrinogen-III synthase [Canicola haemoglobinophilus]|uniref:Uroporphyrinogen-III synthase n=1 Tax=Canicola haemoglobinophilus TaxID=733 RepID=A0A1V4B430_9PAST|nr:uroporphyrinogen-III synthase [Canicola haemoglobinophilus]OOS02382.1 uroporphyrinogen-III synthase [Canicola haemoglobinophilus]STO54974.1 uroporphyrinogen III synthase HEM4 [Canicola haemoglobinophilus]STO59340.1 uroporphyrinogen III synthase HEM4 [Canicola haemoglobinophilus]STO69455.1 uroporphyrinogen III synthase HEM4 [Canicola haemoglobinophilus]
MAVLITRPGERGKQLVDMLNKTGAMAIHLPLISIVAGQELNQLPNKLQQLNAGDYVFVVSQHAVEYAQRTLSSAGFYWRADLHYFTVGQRTAEYFASQTGNSVHYPIEQENSEGLLDLPQMQDLQGKNVLILRGNGGREFVAEQVVLRGAKVEMLECYQRTPVEYNNLEQISLCQRIGVDTIVVTSLEILNYLVALVPNAEASWLLNCRLVTVSQRIAALAKSIGWTHIVVSEKADNSSIFKALQNNG